jgi:hypothetical protein
MMLLRFAQALENADRSNAVTELKTRMLDEDN